MDGYQPTAGDHAENLTTALDRFERALTRRWREEVCGRLSLGMDDYPRSIRAGGSAVPAWNYTLYPHWLHIQIGDCAYLAWALGGPEEDLSAVSCPGHIPATAEMWTNPYTGETNVVPPQIECGMGMVLEQVADWAFAERQHVYEQVPLFTSHDMAALQAAHDTFIELGVQLGLEPKGEPFTPASERDIGRKVDGLAGNSEGADWWAGWTGLAASRAKAGFFASVAPTLNNQSGILGSLANLYAERAAIIEKGRNDTLYWLEWATEALDDTVMVPDRSGWLLVQGIGMGVSTGFGWSGVGAVVGAGISLVGFLGEHLVRIEHERYVHDLHELLGRLNYEINRLSLAIGEMEIGYSADAGGLQEIIHGIHSYNLELYDLTRNNPDGDATCRDTHFSAEMDVILGVAQKCYELGEQYAGLLPALAATAAADRHLADQDGRHAYADRRVLQVRDLLGGLLQTTAGRYLVAGEQVQAAAEAYIDTDFANEEDIQEFNRTMADWEEAGVGAPDVDFDPEGYAQETVRPAGWAPIQEDGSAGPGPGEGDRPDEADADEYGVEDDK